MHRGTLTTHKSDTRFVVLRLINGDPAQSLSIDLAAGHTDRFSRTEDCGAPAGEP